MNLSESHTWLGRYREGKQVEKFASSSGSARNYSPAELDEIARKFETGELETKPATQTEQSLFREGKAAKVAKGRITKFAPRRPQRSPNRKKSRERRNKLGKVCPIPPDMAKTFTRGQLAVFCIIAGEVKRQGICDWPIDKIAACAGVCRTTAKSAMHEARIRGQIRITDRPVPGQKNMTNIVTIVDPEWLDWIRRGPAKHAAEQDDGVSDRTRTSGIHRKAGSLARQPLFWG